MVVQVLAADTAAVCIRIISPAENARIRDIAREEIAEPMDVVCRCPSLVAMSVQPVNRDDAVNNS